MLGEATTDVDVALGEPWQGRAVALAVETCRRLDLPWDAFRDRLKAAVAEDPERPYYDSWLVALEALVTEDVQLEASDLMSRRLAAASYWIDEAGHEDLEVFPLAVSEPVLLDLLTLVFDQWWEHICFGPLINGAVYELRPPHRPTLSMLDGYLTIDFGAGHVHLLDLAREHELFRRNQFEMECSHWRLSLCLCPARSPARSRWRRRSP